MSREVSPGKGEETGGRALRGSLAVGQFGFRVRKRMPITTRAAPKHIPLAINWRTKTAGTASNDGCREAVDSPIKPINATTAATGTFGNIFC